MALKGEYNISCLLREFLSLLYFALPKKKKKKKKTQIAPQQRATSQQSILVCEPSEFYQERMIKKIIRKQTVLK